VISNASAMLKRMVGEDVDLSFIPGENLWPVKVDPNQLEQVLINIVVNARDAMLDGGQVLIETRNVTLDAQYAELHPEATAGDHVQLVVTDSGAGMSAEVQSHLFEPFYTTKEKGHGTGLGLSTVYGIVKQAGGFINVYSELGTGSSFKVYWPRVLEKPEQDARPSQVSDVSGHETILVVEDEDMLRQLIRRILEQRGFRVRAFASGGEAFHWCKTSKEPIDLLLTDVVLPGMNGRLLYESLADMRSGLKVLYMSGYTDNVIAHRGVLDKGTRFIQKPFTIANILARVRAVLDG
jgi:CheY-like chemotaxis protein